MSTAATPTSPGIDLVPEVRCPNCWHGFPPEAALFISGHTDLGGDPRLPGNRKELRRFLPTRFRPDCAAVDVMGSNCRDLACPHCHLLVPRVLLERHGTMFLSIFGRPSAGKSYFLAAMTRQIRSTLPKWFRLGVTEPHPPSNRLVQGYENALFNHPNPDAYVDIPKTRDVGQQWYQTVQFQDEVRQYPRPMFFQIAPLAGHPHGDKTAKYARTLCLYDNAGEDFEAGKAENPNNPVTQHLARSSGLFFIFDPMQEPLFLRASAGRSQDPQVKENMRDKGQDSIIDPQSTILSMADQNIKKFLGREIAQPLDTPLVVIVAKHDAWRHLLPADLADFIAGPAQGQQGAAGGICGLRVSGIERISQQVRDLLLEFTPALVAATERFSRNVYFVPVSATGCGPTVVGRDADSGKPDYKFRVGSIHPKWVEVPLLWMLSRHVPGLVPVESVAGR
jgi:hypothetical protein